MGFRLCSYSSCTSLYTLVLSFRKIDILGWRCSYYLPSGPIKCHELKEKTKNPKSVSNYIILFVLLNRLLVYYDQSTHVNIIMYGIYDITA